MYKNNDSIVKGIIRVIIINIIFIALFFGCLYVPYMISKTSTDDWISICYESFGIVRPTEEDGSYLYFGDENITAREMMDYAVDCIGSDRMYGISGEKNMSSSDALWFFTQKGIIKSEEYDKEISFLRAKKIANELAAYVMDVDNYIQYEEIEYTDNYIDGTAWENVDYDGVGDIAKIVDLPEDEMPKIGNVVSFYEDGYDCVQYRKIVAVENNGNETTLKVEPATNLNDFISVIDISAVGSYNLDYSTLDEIAVAVDYENDMASASANKGLAAFGLAPIDAIKNKIVEKTTINSENRGKIGDLGALFSTSIDTDGKTEVSAELSHNNSTLTIGEPSKDKDSLNFDDRKKKKQKDPEKVSVSGSMSTSSALELKNVNVYSHVYWVMADPSCEDNSIYLMVGADTIKIKNAVDAAMEGSVFIGKITPKPIPIGKTGLTVDLQLYLCATLDGKVEVCYTYGGSLGEPATWSISCANKNMAEGKGMIVATSNIVEQSSEGKYNITGNIGPQINNNLCFAGVSLINPGFYVGLNAEATTEEIVPGYEKVKPCEHVMIKAPVVKVTLFNNEDNSLLGDALSLAGINGFEQEFDQFAPEREIHYEYDEEGKRDSVMSCTHVPDTNYDDSYLQKNIKAMLGMQPISVWGWLIESIVMIIGLFLVLLACLLIAPLAIGFLFRFSLISQFGNKKY